MIRAYALGEAAFGSGVVRTDLMMAAGWAINLAVAEYAIRRHGSRRTASRRTAGRRTVSTVEVGSS